MDRKYEGIFFTITLKKNKELTQNEKKEQDTNRSKTQIIKTKRTDTCRKICSFYHE